MRFAFLRSFVLGLALPLCRALCRGLRTTRTCIQHADSQHVHLREGVGHPRSRRCFGGTSIPRRDRERCRHVQAHSRCICRFAGGLNCLRMGSPCGLFPVMPSGWKPSGSRVNGKIYAYTVDTVSTGNADLPMWQQVRARKAETKGVFAGVLGCDWTTLRYFDADGDVSLNHWNTGASAVPIPIRSAAPPCQSGC